MTRTVVPFVLGPGAKKPRRKTALSAGFDLCATEDVILNPFTPTGVNTKIKVELPENLVMLICPRSGLAQDHGVTVLNAPGVIDADYRGEVGVILINLTPTPYQVKAGDRVAQALFTEWFDPQLAEVDALTPSERGEGGFGSTGKGES